MSVWIRFSCEWQQQQKHHQNTSASNQIKFYFSCKWKKCGSQEYKAVSRWLRFFSVLLLHHPAYVAFCLMVQAGCLNTYYHIIIQPVGRRKHTHISLPLRILSRNHTWHLYLDPVSQNVVTWLWQHTSVYKAGKYSLILGWEGREVFCQGRVRKQMLGATKVHHRKYGKEITVVEKDCLCSSLCSRILCIY